MLSVDLNCDMGESFGPYTIGNDAEAVRYISSANVACGMHASDPTVMRNTVRLCRDHNVMVGAHPGYPDLSGFGRRQIEMTDDEIIDSIMYQVGALKAFLNFFGMPLEHVKLHGALYHYALKKEKLFLDVARDVQKAFGETVFFTLASRETAALKRTCASYGLRLALEAFPDRAYTDEGALVPRKDPEAVIRDPEIIARRALSMVKDKGVMSLGGRWIDLEIDTLCIHGDNAESVLAASLIREYAQNEGITIKAPGV